MRIANEGLEDEHFSKLANSIFKKLTQNQKSKAESLYIELNKIHSIDLIRANIFPKLVSDKESAPEIKPIKREAARYPSSEIKALRMGLTEMEYTISPEGYPRDLVVSKVTNRAFTNSSVKAVKKFIYEPSRTGKPTYGKRIVFTYELEDDGDIEVKTRKLSSELNKLKKSATEGDAVAQYVYATRLNEYRYFKSYLKDIDLQYKTANQWFTKSAEAGLPHSQFEIGRNMVRGKGCEIDVANGHKWINAAAVGGYAPAQVSLARSALSESDTSEEKYIAAIGWLKNAAVADNYSARLLLAWELSTSEVAQIRNGNQALELVDDKPRTYFDEVRIMETTAAANAELGDFDKAVKLQKKAKKTAEKLGWNIPLIAKRLALYQNKQRYRGSYF
jgi:tetratricopeptide (TPR) repeat protein